VNITASIREHAARMPDAPASLTDDRPPLSDRDVDALIDAVAQRMLDAGVRPGRRVAP
jgi:acyl-CoA synthetase (AMP-forming)/AMP-acid ligase II